MKTTLFAFLYTHNLAVLRPKDLKDPAKVLEHCSFSQALYKAEDKIVVGKVEIDVEIANPDDIMKGAVASLRMQQSKVKDEAREAVNALEEQIQSLMALPAPDPQPES